MKTLSSVICIICLLLPAISVANQPCFPCLAKMIEDGSLTEEELQSVISGEWNEEEMSALLAESEEITPAVNLNTLLCYYLAYEAILDFINCLVYDFYSYSCRSAILYGAAYYYFCS